MRERAESKSAYRMTKGGCACVGQTGSGVAPWLSRQS